MLTKLSPTEACNGSAGHATGAVGAGEGRASDLTSAPGAESLRTEPLSQTASGPALCPDLCLSAVPNAEGRAGDTVSCPLKQAKLSWEGESHQ